MHMDDSGFNAIFLLQKSTKFNQLLHWSIGHMKAVHICIITTRNFIIAVFYLQKFRQRSWEVIPIDMSYLKLVGIDKQSNS